MTTPPSNESISPEEQDNLADFIWRSELPARKRMRDALRELYAVQRDAAYTLTYFPQKDPKDPVEMIDARHLVFMRDPDEEDPDEPDPEGNSTVRASMTDKDLE